MKSPTKRFFRWVGGLSLMLFLLTAGSTTKVDRKIELPISIGHKIRGLRLPVRNGEGKLEFRLDVDLATRLDKQNVEMQSATVQTFDQQSGKEDAKIEMKDSTLNMETNQIVSHRPVLVTRSDLRISGDGVDFNTKSRSGKVVGNVVVLIYNRETFSKTK